MARCNYYRGFHHGYYHGYRRGSRKKDDGGMGCLFAIFELLLGILILLFTSDNPTAKKVGWGLVAAIALFYVLASSGVDSDGILAVFGIIIVIGLIVFLVIAFGGNNTSATPPTQKLEDTASQINYGSTTKNIGTATGTTSSVTDNTPSSSIPTVATRKTTKNIQDSNSYKSSTVTLLAPEKKVVEEPIEQEVKWSEPIKAPVQLTEEEKPILCFLKPGEKPTYYASVEAAVKRFSVPEDYRKVMIESIRKTDVKKCPGLAWKDAEKFYVLPLLSNGRYISFKLHTITEIEYKKVPDIDTNTDYMELVKEPIAKEFEELYPEYGFDMDGAYTHNFVIGGNVTVTNTSAKAVFSMLQKGLRVDDEFTQSAQYEEEMKDIYRAYILKLNGVLSFEEYAKIRQEKLDAYRNREKDDKKYNEQIKACKARGMM